MNTKRTLLALTAGLALAGFTSFASAQEVYIPLVSKGFQHQFWQAVKQGADQAAKIPVIAFDSGVDSDIPVTTATTNNVAAAALAADKMAEKIGGEGEVAVIAHDQTSTTGVGRRDGFLNQIKAKYPKIKVVDVQYGGDQLKSAEIAKALLQAHPKLKGIFGTNEPGAIGAGKGIKEAKKSGLVIIGFDSGKAQIGRASCRERVS
jgi:ribose transport system substrate-binding protein